MKQGPYLTISLLVESSLRENRTIVAQLTLKYSAKWRLKEVADLNLCLKMWVKECLDGIYVNVGKAIYIVI